MQLSDTASQRILLPVRASTILGSFALALVVLTTFVIPNFAPLFKAILGAFKKS